MPSTPSSADARSSRRLSRGVIVALVVVSLAIPAGVLALILRAHHSTAADAASKGPLATPEKARIGSLAPDFTLPGIENGVRRDKERRTVAGL